LLLRSAEGKPSFASISPVQVPAKTGMRWGGGNAGEEGGRCPRLSGREGVQGKPG